MKVSVNLASNELNLDGKVFSPLGGSRPYEIRVSDPYEAREKEKLFVIDYLLPSFLAKTESALDEEEEKMKKEISEVVNEQAKQLDEICDSLGLQHDVTTRYRQENTLEQQRAIEDYVDEQCTQARDETTMQYEENM